MKDNILLVVKGFLIGCGKIIPGVSGALIAISLGIYDKAISAILHIFNYKNLKFLGMIGIGFVLAIILLSNILLYLLNNFYVPIMFLFIGLISGGSIELISNIKKNYIYMIIPIMILLILEFLMIKISIPKNIFTYMLVGGIDALTMIIPGISGTAILMIMDFYTLVLDSFATINLSFLIPFIIGMFIVGLLSIKLIDYLYQKKKDKFLTIVLGFSIGSIIILIMNTLKYNVELIDIFVSIITFILGFRLSLLLDSLK